LFSYFLILRKTILYRGSYNAIRWIVSIVLSIAQILREKFSVLNPRNFIFPKHQFLTIVDLAMKTFFIDFTSILNVSTIKILWFSQFFKAVLTSKI